MTHIPSEVAPARPRLSRWSWVLTIVLAVLLLFLALRGIDWQETLATLQRGNPTYLLFGFLLVSLSYFMRGLRWGVLLSAEQRIAPLTMFWGVTVGYLGNTFLPARAGELIRSALISRSTGIGVGYVLSTALTERVLDVIILVLISVSAILLLPDIPEWLVVAVQVMSVAGFVGLGVLLLAPRFEGFFTMILQRLPLIPDGIRSKLIALLEQLLLGMRALIHPGRIFGFLSLSTLIWLADAIAGVIVAQALGLEIGIAAMLVFLAALGLGSAIPSTPGYVGIYQFVAVNVLPLFGWSQSEALAFILTFQAIIILVVVIWGFTGLWRLNQIRPAATPANDPETAPPTHTTSTQPPES